MSEEERKDLSVSEEEKKVDVIQDVSPEVIPAVPEEMSESPEEAIDTSTALESEPKNESETSVSNSEQPGVEEQSEEIAEEPLQAEEELEEVQAPPVPNLEKVQSQETREEVKPIKDRKSLKLPAFFSNQLYSLIVTVLCVMLLIGLIGVNSGKSSLQNELETANAANVALQSELDETSDELAKTKTSLQKAEDELYEWEHGASAQLKEIKNTYEAGDWDEVISLYSQLHKKYNGTDEDAQAKEYADKAQAKIDEEAAAKKKAEEEAAKKKAEEEAKGYETGITYSQLARNPDSYLLDKVKFSGKVVQVQYTDDGSETQIRLAVNNDYDQIILGYYDSDITSSRVLEDDQITIYGISMGDYTYTSVMGAAITVPLVQIDKIDQ